MEWLEILIVTPTLSLVLPLGVAIIIGTIVFFLRRLLYHYFHTWAARTKSQWDDIMVHSTRIASWLWCIWLGIYGGLETSRLVVQLPAFWQNVLVQVIPVLFAALGIYTAIVIITGTIQWYQKEVCPKTFGTMDNKLMAVLSVGVPVIGGILGLFLILSMLGISITAISGWLGEHGGRIALLLVIGILSLLATVLIIPGIIHSTTRRSQTEHNEEELKKRTITLVNVIVTSSQVVIITILFFMLLSEVGINIAPMLAGAGVVGIAVGFGAQSLIKDLIAGLFIIMEDQYRTGDVVKIAGISGLVEQINLRRTVLRDMDGVVHFVPNGQITVASNFTKQWSRVNLNVSVSYGTDLDRAIAVINKVGKELAADPQWASAIVTPPQVLRVDNLGESGIDIKILGDTKPIRQWDVMGELRLRLKREFDKAGIEIPWPHVKVYFGNLTDSIWPEGGENRKPPFVN